MIQAGTRYGVSATLKQRLVISAGGVRAIVRPAMSLAAWKCNWQPMTLVRFFKANGTLDKEVDAAPGQRLLDVAWAAREPLEGACEGVMACSTCHVIVDAEDFENLPEASEEEEDLLDLAAHATRTSRLACQIMLTEEMETLSVRVPPEAKNWMGR